MVSYRTATLISLFATSALANKKDIVTRGDDEPAIIAKLVDNEDCTGNVIAESLFYPDIEDSPKCESVDEVITAMDLTEEQVNSIKSLLVVSEGGAAGNITFYGARDDCFFQRNNLKVVSTKAYDYVDAQCARWVTAWKVLQATFEDKDTTAPTVTGGY